MNLLGYYLVKCKSIYTTISFRQYNIISVDGLIHGSHSVSDTFKLILSSIIEY